MKNYLLFLGDHGYESGQGGEQGKLGNLYERTVTAADIEGGQTFVFGKAGDATERHTVAGSVIKSNFGGAVKRATLNRNKSELDIFVVAGGTVSGKVGNNWTKEDSKGSGTFIGTDTDKVEGVRYKMPDTVTDAVAADGDDFTILKNSGAGGNADDGFTLAAGDVVEMRIGAAGPGRQFVYSYSFVICYPEDAFLGVYPNGTNQTDVHFRSFAGDQSTDILTIMHGTNKHKIVADLIAACLHAGTKGNKYAGTTLVMDSFRQTTFKGLGAKAGPLRLSIVTQS
tara:strand:+ start:410 stop:1258 length:849 start_codon:yes stop_codon:yes gene_type:complete